MNSTLFVFTTCKQIKRYINSTCIFFGRRVLDVPGPSSRALTVSGRLREHSAPECAQQQLSSSSTRRIVTDLVEILHQHAVAMQDHNQGCTFCGQLEFVREARIGLTSTLEYRCTKRPLCPAVHYVRTGKDDMTIHDDFVRGALATGIGFSQARELTAAINMPFMSWDLYHKCEAKLGKDLWDTLLASMKETAAAEIELAKERGELPDAEGYWRVPVIVDGGWSKRSYGHNYNASGGVAVIIGRYTNKVLHVGVRNKFCTVCRRAAAKADDPKPHACACNWKSTSTSMERDIILEGFRESENAYGLRYTTMIGDGDSSVHLAVLTGVSYGHIVKKIECANHVVKCYTKRLFTVAKNAKLFPGKEGIEARKLLSSQNIITMKHLARSTIKRHSSALSGPVTPFAIENLRTQLKNGPYHVFGLHENCPSDCCPVKGGSMLENEQKTAKGLLLVSSGMMVEIQKAVDIVADKSDSLLLDMTSNAAEGYMSAVSKTTGGKRVDHTKGDGYGRRCHLAALAYNMSGAGWHRYFTKKKYGRSPGSAMKKLIRRKKIDQEKRKCRRKLQFPPPVGRPRFSCQQDQDYGESAQQPDLTIPIYKLKANEFMEAVNISTHEQQQIEVSTRGQYENEKWHVERKKRLSSTKFYDICRKHKDGFRYDNVVRSILYPKVLLLPELGYGSTHECDAVAKYKEAHPGAKVKECGLIVSLELPFLCASPDRLVDEDGVLEAKCPYTAANYATLEETSRHHNIGVKVCKKGCLCLNQKHKYYYQIQGQLHVTGRHYCDLVMWSPRDFFEQRIFRNDNFWSLCVPRLRDFYFQYLLPEILDSRMKRKMPLRLEPMKQD